MLNMYFLVLAQDVLELICVGSCFISRNVLAYVKRSRTDTKAIFIPIWSFLSVKNVTIKSCRKHGRNVICGLLWVQFESDFQYLTCMIIQLTRVVIKYHSSKATQINVIHFCFLCSGTNAEFTKADTVIFRTDLYDMNTRERKYNFKRTLKYDSKWLDSKFFIKINLHLSTKYATQFKIHTCSRG